MGRFKFNANEILNEYLFDIGSRNIDGEARVRLYIKLKKQNELHMMMEKNNELHLQNEWVYYLLEEFLTAHEGAWGLSDDDDKVLAYDTLKASNSLHLLFEEHYSMDEDKVL